MNPYIQMARPVNAIMGAVGLMVACFMALGTDADYAKYLPDMLFSSLLVVLFVAGGNSLNDSIDAEIDKIAHPERPVPMGKISVERAHDVGVGLLVFSSLLSILSFDIWCIAIVITAAVLMYLYEVAFKQRGFVGNVTIAVLTGMVFLLGGAIIGDVSANLFPALMAASVSVGREIAKDIEDMDGDEGRRTLPMIVGKKNAGIIATMFFIIGPVLTIPPFVMEMYGPLYLLVVLADIAFVYAAYLTLKNPQSGQKMAKKGMILGLLAFIAGSFRF